jgi:hypothetical protein
MNASWMIPSIILGGAKAGCELIPRHPAVVANFVRRSATG